jgi:hypothetical protein
LTAERTANLQYKPWNSIFNVARKITGCRSIANLQAKGIITIAFQRHSAAVMTRQAFFKDSY